jgi:hypothetical protein
MAAVGRAAPFALSSSRLPASTNSLLGTPISIPGVVAVEDFRFGLAFLFIASQNALLVAQITS